MLLPGCTGEEKPVPEEKGGVQVRIALDGLMTKTTTPGEGAENTVSCLDVIVFSADGTQQLYSWLHGSYSTEGGYYGRRHHCHFRDPCRKGGSPAECKGAGHCQLSGSCR